MTAADGFPEAGSASVSTPNEPRLPVRIVVVGVLLGLVVGGVLGALAGSTRTKTYQATTIASVLPDDALTTAAQLTGTSSSEDSTDFIQGELVVITSQSLRTTVQKELRLAGLPSVSASQSGTTDIVDITATAATPQLAQRVADATRTVYARQRAGELTADVAAANTQVGNQITAVRKQIAATPGAATDSNGALEQEYARLLAVESELALDSAQSAQAVSTIQTAVVAGGGLSDTATYGLAGAILGVLLAAVGLIVLRRARPRIYDVRDLAGLGAVVSTPVLPVGRAKVARAARVLVSGMRGGSGEGRSALVLVGTDGGHGDQDAVAALTVAFQDVSPVLLLCRPGTASSMLTLLPAGARTLDDAELRTKRAITVRLAELARTPTATRIAVVDTDADGLVALVSQDLFEAAAAGGWTVVADSPPLGESRLGVVLAERVGAATALVARGGADPFDVSATIAALRGAGVPQLSLLLYAQPPVWARLLHRGERPTSTDGGVTVPAKAAAATPETRAPAEPPKPSTVPEHEVPEPRGRHAGDPIGNVRPVPSLPVTNESAPAPAARPARRTTTTKRTRGVTS